MQKDYTFTLFSYIIVRQVKGRFFMSRIDHPQLKLAMVLKAHQLSKQSDSNIAVKDVSDCVSKKWNNQPPRRFYQMIFDVFELTVNDVIQTMIKDSMRNALKTKLSEYEDVIGGSK